MRSQWEQTIKRETSQPLPAMVTHQTSLQWLAELEATLNTELSALQQTWDAADCSTLKCHSTQDYHRNKRGKIVQWFSCLFARWLASQGVSSVTTPSYNIQTQTNGLTKEMITTFKQKPLDQKK